MSTNQQETLDVLPGEGETRTETKRKRRRECEECGAPAHYKQTFLLEGTRSNPASAAYGRDDCTYCEDKAIYLRREHRSTSHTPDGYVKCARFPASARFAHLFLYDELVITPLQFNASAVKWRVRTRAEEV